MPMVVATWREDRDPLPDVLEAVLLTGAFSLDASALLDTSA